MPATQDARTMIESTTIGLTGNRELRGRMPLFDVCLGLATLGLMVAMLARRPELLGLSAPFVILIAVALGTWSDVKGTVRVGIDSAHIVEGDVINVVVEVEAASKIDRLEIEVHLSDRVIAEGTLRAVTSVDAATVRSFAFPVRAEEWGVARIRAVSIRVTDRFGMFGGSLLHPTTVPIRIGLAEDRLRASLEAEHFRRVVGSHLSNDRGQGMEIADIRAYLPGDSMRDINWRITNRRQEPWVTLRHPDRSTSVVVIVDAHDGENAAQHQTQRRSVTAALALARGHLAMHDPVGLLVVGHTVRWVPPRLGRNQLHRIADELISVSNAPDASLRMYRPSAVASISRESIVVAVSPLRDPLMVALIAELRSRGNPIAVLVPEVEEVPRTRLALLGKVQMEVALARRFAAVERAIGVESLRSRGVVLVEWKTDEPVTAVIQAVTRLRQSMRRLVT